MITALRYNPINGMYEIETDLVNVSAESIKECIDMVIEEVREQLTNDIFTVVETNLTNTKEKNASKIWKTILMDFERPTIDEMIKCMYKSEKQ